MTTETLDRANKIKKQITYYKNLISDMHHTRRNMFCIVKKYKRTISISINEYQSRDEILDDDDELWNLIMNYFKDKKTRLETELEELR